MSELAFNANGENFEVPAAVTGWRVRRLKPRGAPELVYGRDGRPLTISIESSMDELRDAVGAVLGRYRLDPIDDDGKTIADVPAAYIQVVKPDRPVETAAPVVISETDSVIKDAMRLNTELARAVIDRFPEVMHAAAELLRAADGAGLPARQPREAEEEEDDGIEEVAPQKSGVDLVDIATKIIPPLVAAFASGDKSRLPSFAEMLDWRKAVPKVQPTDKGPAKTSGEPTKSTVNPAEAMARVGVVLDKLTPEERMLAVAFAQEITLEERMAWFRELAPLSDDEAVARVRKILGAKSEGGAS